MFTHDSSLLEVRDKVRLINLIPTVHLNRYIHFRNFGFEGILVARDNKTLSLVHIVIGAVKQEK